MWRFLLNSFFNFALRLVETAVCLLMQTHLFVSLTNANIKLRIIFEALFSGSLKFCCGLFEAFYAFNSIFIV